MIYPQQTLIDGSLHSLAFFVLLGIITIMMIDSFVYGRTGGVLLGRSVEA